MENFKGVSPHRPLSEDGKDIRIIKLLPNTFNSPIECELEHIVLQPEADYEAVSYCWGNSSITRPILVDGKPYPITLNLFDGLKYLRREDLPRQLWVDSLCINQTDMEERGREILKMRDIYKFANGVLIWLGDYLPYTRSHVKQVFDYVTMIVSCYKDDEEWALLRTLGYDELWRLQSQLQEFIQSREWFERMWILQEVSVRPKPWVKNVDKAPNMICGDLTLPFPYLYWIHEFWVTTTENKRIGLPPICPSLDRMGIIWQGYQDILTTEKDFSVAQKCAWILASVAARFHSTNPRDIIYATLGLLNADPLPPELRPDYRKHPNQILTDYASFIMDQSRLLTITLFNSMQTKGLPSWVPDWRYASWCPIAFAESPHSKTHIRVLKDMGAIEVDVIELTKVIRVGPQLQHHESAERVIGAWSNFFLDAEEDLFEPELPAWGYSSFGKSLWQLLLVFDLVRHELHEPGWHLSAAEHVPPLFFWERTLRRDKKTEYGPRGIFLKTMLEALGAAIAQRFLFRGMDGSIGIICQPGVEPREGDMICTIKGAFSDVVLREYLDGYKIVGHCERTVRGYDLTIRDIGFGTWAGADHLYSFYEEFWDLYEGQRIIIY
ncbi:HET-domain-containing protein [Xylariaceae sp. AK1471]|nr:HET-domain-containing protein [Xylariaceae sp. AK1471]